MQRSDFNKCRRIVVKVGTSSLAYNTGKLNLTYMGYLVRQLADLYNHGKEVLLVSSGAIGAGAGKLGLRRTPRSIPEKQACAAIGQGMLLHMYEKMFAEYGITVGQVLLTRDDFAVRQRFINAENTLSALLAFGAVPVINENDTVAVDEIKLGDNDHLGALLAGLVDADLLLLLTDAGGLYTADPRKDPEARLIPWVEEITTDLEERAGSTGSVFGTGGMAAKLSAARIAMQAGVTTVIAHSAVENVLHRVLDGEELGTVFAAKPRKMEMRKQWIAYGACVAGRIYVDAGAARALREKGKSLLPSGVLKVEGGFEAGQAASIIDPEGKEIGRGLVNYSATEVNKIKGCQSADVTGVLGYCSCEEVIHRNNMVVEP